MLAEALVGLLVLLVGVGGDQAIEDLSHRKREVLAVVVEDLHHRVDQGARRRVRVPLGVPPWPAPAVFTAIVVKTPGCSLAEPRLLVTGTSPPPSHPSTEAALGEHDSARGRRDQSRDTTGTG